MKYQKVKASGKRSSPAYFNTNVKTFEQKPNSLLHLKALSAQPMHCPMASSYSTIVMK